MLTVSSIEGFFKKKRETQNDKTDILSYPRLGFLIWEQFCKLWSPNMNRLEQN